MSNDKNQQAPTQPEKFKPSQKTIFLLQNDPDFEKRARDYLTKAYGNGVIDPVSGDRKQLRIVTEIDGNKLTEGNVLVVLYQNPDAPIRDANGDYRERDMGEKMNGKWSRKPEKPKVYETTPFVCKDHWIDNGDNDDGVDVVALVRAINENIAKAQKGQPASVRINDRNEKRIMQVRAV